MRQVSILLAILALIALAMLPVWANSSPDQPGTDSQQSPLIVHEWGTFTSFSGSDGVKLEFRPLVDQDLPRFVFSQKPSLEFLVSKPSLRAIQRMETPVTYFYTPEERDVEVRVEFPEGLLTEYYPPVRQFAPQLETPFWRLQENYAQNDPSELQPELTGGLLDWGTVHLIPQSSLHAKVNDEELSRRLGRHIEQQMFEPAGDFIHYSAARETDSAIVQARFPAGNKAGVLAGDYFEKFLFYRGLGNFELPLALSEMSADTFELTNTGDDEVRSLFLVSVRGKTIRFRKYDRSDAQSRMTLHMPAEVSMIKNLGAAMIEALQAEGLYEKEARAMVKCWRSSWFGEEGTRLLYMVPTKTTDTLLPLHVTPTPAETVRVLVGRMEIMPATQEQQILELVQKSATARQQAIAKDVKGFRSPVLTQLEELGRLAEPALVRVEQIAEDATSRQEARRLIQELRGEPAATVWNNDPGFDISRLWAVAPAIGE